MGNIPLGNIPLDDKGIGGGLDEEAGRRADEQYDRRYATPALVGVKTAGDEPTILIVARVGGASVIGDVVQDLLRAPTAGGLGIIDSPWVEGESGPECDPLGAVPYLTARLMECTDGDEARQDLYVWATNSMELHGTTPLHPLFPVVDFGAKLVRAFEIEGSTAHEITTWTFEEFTDANWQRRGHPFHTLDPEFVQANHIAFAPDWAKAPSSRPT